MRPTDLPGARRLQHQERWNQTIEDWELFLRATPEGCFVAVDSAAASAEELVVGTVTSIRFPPDTCWISMLLVDRGWRGHGIGGKLMQRAIAANEDACACLRLDATPAGRPVYEKLGFRADYELERWVLDDPGDVPERPNRCTRLTPEAIVGVREHDFSVFGSDRTVVLHHLLQNTPEGAWMIDAHDAAPAYVLARAGEEYYQIGPLIAQADDDIAALLGASLDAAGARQTVVDAVAANHVIRRHLERVGFRVQRPFTRMSRGAVPKDRTEYIAAASGPEFG